ncbi:MAG: hypothetical protein P4L48_01525 [Mycobacterium sp.]|nr:hypothetical protein [Mycobacterium sp.]
MPIAQVARDLEINAGMLGNWWLKIVLNVKARRGFRPMMWPS